MVFVLYSILLMEPSTEVLWMWILLLLFVHLANIIQILSVYELMVECGNKNFNDVTEDSLEADPFHCGSCRLEGGNTYEYMKVK